MFVCTILIKASKLLKGNIDPEEKGIREVKDAQGQATRAKKVCIIAVYPLMLVAAKLHATSEAFRPHPLTREGASRSNWPPTLVFGSWIDL